jgi:hypothetical protein
LSLNRNFRHAQLFGNTSTSINPYDTAAHPILRTETSEFAHPGCCIGSQMAYVVQLQQKSVTNFLERWCCSLTWWWAAVSRWRIEHAQAEPANEQVVICSGPDNKKRASAVNTD